METPLKQRLLMERRLAQYWHREIKDSNHRRQRTKMTGNHDRFTTTAAF